VHCAFLFPGQGSQFPGMCVSLLQEFPFVKKYFLEANEVLNFDILDLCLNGTEDKLNQTANAQPSILIVGYCAFQILLNETGIKPFLMAGHSLGEISALCCSGAISFSDALRIVRKRGELMQAAVSEGKGAMLALNGITLNEVENICSSCASQGIVVVSNINSQNQIVISGEKNGVNAVGILAGEKGAVKIPLKVSAPFHSPLMKTAAAGLESELNNYSYSKLKYPVISNVTCKPYLDQNEIIPLLTDQVITKVNWLKIMDYIEKTRVNITLELPPKKILTGFFKSQKSAIINYAFDQLSEVVNLLNVEIL